MRPGMGMRMATSIKKTAPATWSWAFDGDLAAINRMSLRAVAREMSRKLGHPVSPATVIQEAKRRRQIAETAEPQPTAQEMNAFDERRETSYEREVEDYERRELGKLLNSENRHKRMVGMIERIAPAIPRRAVPPQLRFDPVTSKERVVVGVLSDMQAGTKVDPLEVGARFSFDTNVLVQRFEEYRAKLFSLICEQMALGPVRKLLLWIVGDLIENHKLHGESSALHTDLCNVTACRVLADLLIELCVQVTDTFGLAVEIECVPGNHDRIGAKNGDDYTYENWATVIMEYVKRSLVHYPVTVTMHTGEGAYLAYWGWNVYLHHGHGISGMSSAPVGNVAKRMVQVEGMLRNQIHYAVVGHFHAIASQMTNSGMEVYVNGSWFPTNAYAHKFALATEAQQLAFVLTEDEGIVYTRKIYLGYRVLPPEQPLQRMSA